MTRARLLAFSCILAMAALRSPAQGSAFELSLGVDIPAAAVSAGAFALSFALTPPPGDQPAIEDIPGFDRAFMGPYDSGLDGLSAILAYGIAIAPASVLLFLPPSWKTAWTYAAMYGEAFFLSYGLKDCVKELFPRYRPYTFYGPSPAGLEDEYRESMPSGHTTIAFMGATFLMASLLAEGVDRRIAWPVIGGGYALACATGALRIASGSHFLSDVAAGAALGGLVGWAVPALHRKRAGTPKAAVAFAVSADGSLRLSIPL
jgi:membrane-associated phospholipid phosphatase